MSKPVLILYNPSTMAGKAAASIVRYFNSERRLQWREIEKIADVPFGLIESGNFQVYLIGVAFKKERMEKLNEMTDLFWIDNREKLEIPEISGLRNERNLMQLCWQYFQADHPNQGIRNSPLPEGYNLIYLKELYESTDKIPSSDNAIPFNYGLLKYDPDMLQPDSHMWYKIITRDASFMAKTVTDGYIIMQYLVAEGKRRGGHQDKS